MEWLILSMVASLAVGVAAFVATMREADRYFDEKPSRERIRSYRIPVPMMIGIGLCFAPIIGVAYTGLLWAVYFSGKRFG